MLPTDDPIIQTFLEGDLFASIGLADLSSEEKAGILSTMSQTVHARAWSHVYDLLDESGRQTLETIPVDNLLAFLSEKNIDFLSLLISEAVRHRMEVVMMYRSTFPGNQPVPAS